MLMFNFRINSLEAVQMVWDYLVLYFLRFLPAGYHSVYIISPCTFAYSANSSSYEILNLAELWILSA